MPPENNIIAGFSPANRYIFYASLILSPAHALSAVSPRWPSNIAFLTYNAYQQYLWYRGVQSHSLHAMSLIPIHLNMVSTITYPGGIPAGTDTAVALQCFSVIALIFFNTCTMWIGWTTNLPDGYEVYKFYLFGERTLSRGWRVFNLLWAVWNTLQAVIMTVSVIWLSISLVRKCKKGGKKPESAFKGTLFERVLKWMIDLLLGRVGRWSRRILWGATCIAILVAPFVYWMEAIVKANDIVSEVDTVSIWLFAVQVLVMVIGGILQAMKPTKDSSSASVDMG